jgi:hypothetical protein
VKEGAANAGIALPINIATISAATARNEMMRLISATSFFRNPCWIALNTTMAGCPEARKA